MNASDAHDTPDRVPQQAGWGYLATVGVLLTAIVVLLAVLAVRERARRIQAEQQLEKDRRSMVDMQNALGQMLQATAEAAVEPLRRDDLPSQTVSLDGQRRTLLTIGSAAGVRFGLQPGDLVLVAGEASEGGPADAAAAEEPGGADAAR